MFVKILYVLLVLSTLALLWAVGAAYLRVRRHMSGPGTGSLKDGAAEQEREKAAGED